MMNQPDASAALRFRPNVAGIIQNARGEILICERLHFAGSWQFPQGGIDEGEERRAALVREMEEELGVTMDDYEILDCKGPYRYLFAGKRKKNGFVGQEQFYYLLQFTGPESRICVETAHREFRQARWISPKDFQLSWLPEFKKEVYKSVFYDFFDLSL